MFFYAVQEWIRVQIMYYLCVFTLIKRIKQFINQSPAKIDNILCLSRFWIIQKTNHRALIWFCLHKRLSGDVLGTNSIRKWPRLSKTFLPKRVSVGKRPRRVNSTNTNIDPVPPHLLPALPLWLSHSVGTDGVSIYPGREGGLIQTTPLLRIPDDECCRRRKNLNLNMNTNTKNTLPLLLRRSPALSPRLRVTSEGISMTSEFGVASGRNV